MDEILDATNGFLGLKGKRDDDFIDRLSSRYSVVLILVFAALITFYQFNAAMISCWCPAHFTDSHIKYTEMHCWVKNTYYLPFEEEIPRVYEDDKRQMVKYYQWIPFVLLIQALFFYLPSLVWHSLNQKGGIDSDNILATAQTLHKTEKEENRENILHLLTNQLHRFLWTRKNTTKTVGSGKPGLKSILASCCSLCGRRVGSYLTILYLVSKVLYIANILVQIFFLNLVLHTSFGRYGIDVLTSSWTDHDWHDSPGDLFPRVTMCDINVRRLGNLHRYTIQCALPLNRINEKVYIFLWFWFIFVAVFTLCGFVQWLLRALLPKDRMMFVQNHLKLMGRLDSAEKEDKSVVFVTEYLRQDGAFILRLIRHNTNFLTTREVICHLWDNWLARYGDKLGENGEKKLVDKDSDEDEEKDAEGMHV